jgi:hypothetical protein
MKKLLIISSIICLAGYSAVNASIKDALAKKYTDGKKEINDRLKKAQTAAEKLFNPTIDKVETAIKKEVKNTSEYNEFCQDPSLINRLKLESRILLVFTVTAQNHCTEKKDDFPFAKSKSGCWQGYLEARKELTKWPQ